MPFNRILHTTNRNYIDASIQAFTTSKTKEK